MAKKPATKGEVTDKVLAALTEKLQKGGPLLVEPEIARWRCGLLRLSHGKGGLGGGWPKGRFIEIHGPSDAGKTTKACEVVRDIVDQEQETLQDPHGRRIAIYDHEGVLDREYAEKIIGKEIGHVDRLGDLPDAWRAYQVLYFIPETFEADAKLTGTLLRHDRLLFSVHDSVAAMTPTCMIRSKKGEIDGLDNNQPAILARLTGQWFPRWKKLAVEHGAGALYTNHAKKGFQTNKFVPPSWNTPGGEAPKFYADIRIRVIGGKSEVYPNGGRKMYVQVIRNKTSRERGGKFEYHANGLNGIDRFTEAMGLALEAGIVKWVNAEGKVVAATAKNRSALRTEDGETMSLREFKASLGPDSPLYDQIVEYAKTTTSQTEPATEQEAAAEPDPEKDFASDGPDEFNLDVEGSSEGE